MARQPDVDIAYMLLWRGIAIGWIIPTRQGWQWQTSDLSPRIGTSVYTTWATAAAALTRTRTALRTTGPGATVRAGQWRPVVERPWTPTPQGDDP